MIQLTLDNLSVALGGRTIIDRISAEFHGGEMTAIIGRNGAGKTTLIKAIANLTSHSGAIRLTESDDMPLDRSGSSQLSPNDDSRLNGSSGSQTIPGGRTPLPGKEIAYVPQLASLTSRLTVFEMILLGLSGSLRWHVTNEQLHQVNHIIEEMHLESIARQPFHTLSGGQKQLVSMAQSLISRPKVLLLDEPTSALDLRHQLIVMDLAQKYTRDTGAVTIFVVHDLMLASRYGASLLLLHQGKIRAFGSAEEVLQPELLEQVYHVEISVERTKNGFLNAIPVRPLDV